MIKSSRNSAWSSRNTLTAAVTAAGIALGAVFISPAVLAQAQPPPVKPGDPRATPPEKIEPPQSKPGDAQVTPGVEPRPNSTDGASNGRSDGEPLGEVLSRTDGVLKPPPNIDPKVVKPAPVPNPGTTPVIPPPGSPGNPSQVRPK